MDGYVEYHEFLVVRAQRILVSVSSTLSLEFVFKFDKHSVNIYLKITYYGFCYISNGLIVLIIAYLLTLQKLSYLITSEPFIFHFFA